MNRRGFLTAAGAAVGTAILARPLFAQTAARTIQVRVYRQPRPGKYEFLAGIRVRLCNGQEGVTRSEGGVKGTVDFPNVSCKSFYAEAYVNKKWIRSSRSEQIGKVLRLDVIVP